MVVAVPDRREVLRAVGTLVGALPSVGPQVHHQIAPLIKRFLAVGAHEHLRSFLLWDTQLQGCHQIQQPLLQLCKGAHLVLQK